MKKILSALVICALLIFAPFFSVNPARAAAYDEILEYDITATPLEDATLLLEYHIEWKVLDDSIGALEWVSVGLPNSDIRDIHSSSGNISSLEIGGSGSSTVINVYFDRPYYEGEIVCFDFSVVQGHIYEAADEGKIRYYFTPGWFDEIDVDHISIRWKGENAESWTPSCILEGEYLNFEGSLKAGAKFTVQVTYPENAFDVDIFEGYYDYDPYEDDYSGYTSGYSYDDYYDDDDDVDVLLGFVIFVLIIWGVCKVCKSSYDYVSGAFMGKTYENKVTRTKVEYYPTCQGCGAARPEGKETCEYCGRSFIKSEEKITEEIKTPEAEEARKRTTAGTYHYGSIPNTYVRVNVTRVPVPRGSHRPGGSSSHRSSCVHSSCAHSSCACASHCACACACACAGGGRAGCSTKDFYNTGLKLSRIKKLALREK